MPFIEDLTVFFKTSEFASNATLAGLAVTGIFEKDYIDLDAGGSLAGTTPVFTLASSAVPANVAGATLVVGGVTYKVVEPMPDGTGVTMLRLRT